MANPGFFPDRYLKPSEVGKREFFPPLSPRSLRRPFKDRHFQLGATFFFSRKFFLGEGEGERNWGGSSNWPRQAVIRLLLCVRRGGGGGRGALSQHTISLSAFFHFRLPQTKARGPNRFSLFPFKAVYLVTLAIFLRSCHT